MSVSTHDDDWDAEVGFEDVKKSNIKAVKAGEVLSSEMQIQMQQMARSTPRSMQNVMVTDDDESEHLGSSTFSSPSKELKNANKLIVQNNSNSSLNGRAPYRHVPYSDGGGNISPKKDGTTLTNSISSAVVQPQNIDVSIGDDEDDDEVEISLL